MAGRLGPAHPVSRGHLLGEVRVAGRFPGEVGDQELNSGLFGAAEWLLFCLPPAKSRRVQGWVTGGRDAESRAIKTVGGPCGVKRADGECKGGADGRLLGWWRGRGVLEVNKQVRQSSGSMGGRLWSGSGMWDFVGF